MALIVYTSQYYRIEKQYIFRIFLSEFLGLQYRIELHDDSKTLIKLDDSSDKKQIVTTDYFFRTRETEWLTEKSTPKQPLKLWKFSKHLPFGKLTSNSVPVLFGGDPTEDEFFSISDNSISTKLDIFGSAFFMLTRYEELVKPDRDEHGRFPATASLAYQEGFLEKPIVDEYVEILWAALKYLWPGLTRKENKFTAYISCDVDNPYAAQTKSIISTYRKMGGDIIKRRSAGEAFQTWLNFSYSLKGDFHYDPYWSFDWIMDLNEKAGNQLAFYFPFASSVPEFDAHYDVDEPRIRSLMSRIHQRGHEIGMHGSYASYKDVEQLKSEAQRLKRVFMEEGIEQPSIGNRQHYLRWSSSETHVYLDEAGLDYDTTLSYADHPGFRCGTCREYPMFDLLSRKELNLIQRPLIIMECSLMDNSYLGVNGVEDACTYFKAIMDQIKMLNGAFTMLWHNSSLTDDCSKSLYVTILEMLNSNT